MQLCIVGQTIPYSKPRSMISRYDRVSLKLLFIMRVSVFMMGFFTLMASLYAGEGRSQNPEDIRISLKLEHASLKETLKQIETLTPFKFLASADDVEREGDITLSVKDQPVRRVLQMVFKGRNIQYKQVGVNIILKRDKEPLKKTAGTSIASPVEWRAEKYSVSGTVKSARTGETILGATIRVASPSTGAASNEYGFYSLTLPEGRYLLEVSAVGFAGKAVDINLSASITVNIQMDEEAKGLQEVTVTAATNSRSLKSPQMGLEKLNIKETKNIPVIFGERDILKTVQLLPGIKAAGDGNSGFYVRGGSADQNLILLDEAPVYNASHLLGFFSTFNSDAIKNVAVYKGGMPAQYGGRLSSVLDIKMNDGNNKDMNVSGGVGLIAARLNIEGPIQNDKSSFLISGRRTYADMFLKLSSDTNISRSKLYFYDLNAKANYIFGDKDRLYLSGYFGRDVLSQNNQAGINWGNTTATLRWNHLFNSKLFSNTSLIYSNFDYKINVNQDGNKFNIFSQIRDLNFKEELQWYAGSKNTINTGINAIYHTIRPGEISAVGNDAGVNSITLPWRYSVESAVYATNTWKPAERFSLTYGLRVSAFTILGKGDYYNFDASGNVTDTMHYSPGQVVKTYVNPEPRVAASFQVNNSTSVKASYTRNTQYLHLVSNSTTASPTDKWVGSTNVIKPEIADQYSVGYYKNLSDDKYELTVEAYYKDMQNQIDYRNGANIYTNTPIETQLLYGIGRAYGIEFLLKKKVGKFTGWVSYTLSKSERKINGINNDQWYNAKQDRTHDIAIVGMYELNKKWTFSANWVFYTGDAVTFPNGKYTVDGNVYFYYTNRNGYRMPNYHRLDLGATCQLKKHKHFSSELAFSIFNAYGRQNAYQIDFRQGKNDPNITEAVQTSLFTFVPSISYNFKF
jgi:TonB-dependent receptor-like protein/carboxypeptidase-like protein